MAKFCFQGGYTAETWARFMENPADRTDVVRRVCESVGCQLEHLYWSFGHDDFLLICECPDEQTAAAVSVAVASTGALRDMRTTRLIEAHDLKHVLEKARTARAAYTPHGAMEPARTR